MRAVSQTHTRLCADPRVLYVWWQENKHGDNKISSIQYHQECVCVRCIKDGAHAVVAAATDIGSQQEEFAKL